MLDSQATIPGGNTTSAFPPPNKETLVLDVRNVEIVYHDVILAVKGISIQVPTSAIVAVLGSNGAGKSTVLKAIAGILKSEDGEVTDGKIHFNGQNVVGLEPHVISRKGITLVPEGRGVLWDLSVLDNLKLGIVLSKLREDAGTSHLETVFELFPPLQRRPNIRAGYLSGGEQQMLALGRALLGMPKLLMLDEPSLGLAPLITRNIFDVIERINRENRTSILLVEQNARLALAVAKYGYVLENGRIMLDDDARLLNENKEVREFYLGFSTGTQHKSYKDVKHYKRKKRWLSS